MNIKENPKLVVNLLPHQEELLQLSELAGIYINHGIFRIIVELLNMQIHPDAIFKLLKRIRRSSQRLHQKSPASSTTSPEESSRI